MKKYWSVVLAILGVISIVVAIIYFVSNAGHLPSFFLGYTKNSTHKHIKHAIAFLSLGVVLFIGAWVTSGGEKQTRQKEFPEKE